MRILFYHIKSKKAIQFSKINKKLNFYKNITQSKLFLVLYKLPFCAKLKTT